MNCIIPLFTYEPIYFSSIQPSSGINYVMKITQEEKCTYKLNNEARSRNHSCRDKSNKYLTL